MPVDPLTLTAIGTALFPTIRNLFGGGGGSNNGTDIAKLLQQMPQLRALLGLQVQEAQRRASVQAALLNLSQNLLPKSAYRPPVNPFTVVTPAPNGRRAGATSELTGDTAMPRPLEF